MPILTISEIVNNELSQMRFRFGGTPADVVEYSDGGRKASGQAISVEGLEIVTENWIVQETSVVPTADEHGMVEEFYGPKGIIALKVDFGFGPVILRADAANLHKELRDILLDRLSQLQIDNDSFRDAVTGELDSMRSEIDNAVSDALADVQDLIDTSLGDSISDAVDAKLATDLQPTLSAAINDALENDVPPLITAEVASQVPPEVTSQVSGLQDDINLTQQLVDEQGVSLASTRFDLDATKYRVTQAEGRLTAVEALVTLTNWSRTYTATDAYVTIKLTRFQGLVFGRLELQARSNNNGAQGYVARSGAGIPSAMLPEAAGMNVSATANLANGEGVVSENFRLGITPTGEIISQGYDPWHLLRANFVYFTS